ncbi:Phage protein [hydrothermal vent metagenome]|uniref:Phage protein n=1 Tax=hydrothermal vent metagenome TaxID=652676 RepID=A0A1W1BVC4_9ZZZZ
MTFDDKYQSLIEQLENRVTPAIIPSKHLKHNICDFIEIYTFFYYDKVSKSEILDLLSDYEFSFTDTSEEILTANELSDIKESVINILFDALEYRASILGAKYPFTIENRNTILLKDNLSIEQKVYLVLLFSSLLSIFNEFQGDLTSEFEYIVYLSLKKFFPLQTVIKQFGKNSDYSGTAQEKIKALGRDLKIHIRDEEVNQVMGNQEKGLDIIAWIPFSDGNTNMLIYLFQCACGKEWIKKFSETKRYLAYYDFYKLQPMSVIAISYGLNMMGEFEKNDEIIASESLFFDRLRIIEFFDEELMTDINDLNSIKLIEKLLEDRIEIGL